jgi:uncharacterized protein involved in exopolysaccharide biosynthesis
MKSIEVARSTDVRSAPLGEIGSILSRRKWQILIMFVLIVIVVAVVTYRMPKQYESHMKILVKNDRANMVVGAGVNAQLSTPGEISETGINTEIELLNSSDLLQQVATATGLEKLEPTGATPPDQRQQLALQIAVNRLQHDLKIWPVKKADVIEVDYTSVDPRRAAAVLRQLAASYLEAHLRVHGTPGTHEFFLSQAARYQAELKDAEARLSTFRTRNDIVMFAQQKEDILRRAGESNSMLMASEAAIREYTQKIADARVQFAATEPRVVTQSRTLSNQVSVERLSTMIVELQNKRTQLMSKFRSDDRLVQEVSQELADTQAALEKAKSLTGSEQATDINPVRQTLALELAREQSELAGIQERRQALKQQTDGYRQQLNRLGNSTTEYDDLIRTQKEAEDNYLLYARKAEEARITDSLDQQKIANVAIAENPVEPLWPIKPNVQMNLTLGTLLAGFLSLGVAFSAEYLQQPFPGVDTDSRVGLGPAVNTQPLLETIEQPADLEALTGLPVLAITSRS